MKFINFINDFKFYLDDLKRLKLKKVRTKTVPEKFIQCW
jgi:hypothetical protein